MFNTECLNDSEFHDWHLYNFHCKILNDWKVIKIIYQSSDKENVLKQFKEDCEEGTMNLNVKSVIWTVRKGKRVYPELHKRVLEHTKSKENQ